MVWPCLTFQPLRFGQIGAGLAIGQVAEVGLPFFQSEVAIGDTAGVLLLRRHV